VTEPLRLPPSSELVAWMESVVRGERYTGGPGWARLVGELVASNLRQWDLEDTSRDPAADDATVAAAKREIDRLNLGRHRMVEEIDAAIGSVLVQPAAAPIATESPGMALDRLSVLVIRRARIAAALSGGTGDPARAAALEAQLAALCVAFDTYMEELRAGTRRFVAYEHLKFYGPLVPTAG